MDKESGLKLLFLHVPKAAGTSLDSVISQSSVRSVHHVETVEAIENALANNYQYIGGHFTVDMLEGFVLPKGANLVTLLRNPLDRYISDLNYHIEILRRGGEFYGSHGPKARKVIRATFDYLVDSSSDFAIQGVARYFGEFFDGYYFRRLIPAYARRYLASDVVGPRDAVKIVKDCLCRRFAYLGVLEVHGVEPLARFSFESLSLASKELSGLASFRNASRNFLDPSLLVDHLVPRLSSRENILSGLVYQVAAGELDDMSLLVDWDAAADYVSSCISKSSAYLDMDQVDSLAGEEVECIRQFIGKD